MGLGMASTPSLSLLSATRERHRDRKNTDVKKEKQWSRDVGQKKRHRNGEILEETWGQRERHRQCYRQIQGARQRVRQQKIKRRRGADIEQPRDKASDTKTQTQICSDRTDPERAAL